MKTVQPQSQRGKDENKAKPRTRTKKELEAQLDSLKQRKADIDKAIQRTRRGIARASDRASRKERAHMLCLIAGAFLAFTGQYDTAKRIDIIRQAIFSYIPADKAAAVQTFLTAELNLPANTWNPETPHA